MSEDVSHSFSYVNASSFKSGFDKVKEEDPEVDEEWIPHDGKGEDGPLDVTLPLQVKKGEQVCPNIGEWDNSIEQPKQADFDCH